MKKFLSSYCNSICKRKEFEIGRVKWEHLKATCTHAKHTVAGMSGFSPSDFALLSDNMYHWLAHLLNLVEDGVPWPIDLCSAKAAYLSEDPLRTEDPLGYRVLLILPVLYRRWASARLT